MKKIIHKPQKNLSMKIHLFNSIFHDHFSNNLVPSWTNPEKVGTSILTFLERSNKIKGFKMLKAHSKLGCFIVINIDLFLFYWKERQNQRGEIFYALAPFPDRPGQSQGHRILILSHGPKY